MVESPAEKPCSQPFLKASEAVPPRANSTHFKGTLVTKFTLLLVKVKACRLELLEETIG